MVIELGNPFYLHEGKQCWTATAGDRYDVTGMDRNGKRFSMQYKDWRYASQINVWRGSYWLVRGGKRWLINRVYN